MPIPSLPFGNLLPSRQLVAGSALNRIHDLLTSFRGGPNAGIVALAGGARSALTPILDSAFCEITVCATGSDSVVLPVAKVGLNINVTNNGAAAAQVFGNGTDTINGTAGATGVALASGATALYICTKNGVWRRFVSA